MPLNSKLMLLEEGGALRAAADVLRRGGIVAFPTETVYGLAVRDGDRTARQRLRCLKQREANKPFQILLSSRRAAFERCPGLCRAGRKLARTFWPGPLTLVAKSSNGQWLGLRVPDHAVARSLARRVGGLIATSANLSGRRTARTGREVLKTLGGRVDLVLDGGVFVASKPSSVVRVSEDGWEVLREGALSAREIEAALGNNVFRKG